MIVKIGTCPGWWHWRSSDLAPTFNAFFPLAFQKHVCSPMFFCFNRFGVFFRYSESCQRNSVGFLFRKAMSNFCFYCWSLLLILFLNKRKRSCHHICIFFWLLIARLVMEYVLERVFEARLRIENKKSKLDNGSRPRRDVPFFCIVFCMSQITHLKCFQTLQIFDHFCSISWEFFERKFFKLLKMEQNWF